MPILSKPVLIKLLSFFTTSALFLITAAIQPNLDAMTMTIGGRTLNTAGSVHTTTAQTNGSNEQKLPQVPLDVDQYPVAPAGLELAQVHVFVRHGESG